MSYETDLTDAQWALLEPWFADWDAAHRSRGGKPRTLDRRDILNALFYQARTGCQWRMIPHDFPVWGTVRYYFDQWTANGTLEAIHTLLRQQVRSAEGRDPEPTAWCVDSQSVKTTEAGGERGYDGGTKNQRS